MIEWVTYSSRCLQGFPMGDRHERQFPVYVPPGYDLKRKEPYPLLFVLAGWGGKAAKYVSDESAFGVSLPKQLDLAIETKRLPACIVAFPDGSSRLGGSQYVNSPAFGNYLDYYCDELTTFLDSKFHTFGTANQRAVMGHSSGGFGALLFGMMRPDRFSHIYCSASDADFPSLFFPLIKTAIVEIERAGGLETFVDEFLNHPNPSSLGGRKFDTMMLLSMAPCYAPNIHRASLFGDLFFDLKTGEIINDVWNRWLKWDPLELLENHREGILKLKSIFLDAGAQDEYGLHLAHRKLSKKFKALGIKHSWTEVPGGHTGQSWRMLSRIESLLKAMA